MSNGLQLAYSLVRSSDPLIKRSVVICHGLFGSKQNWKSMSHALCKQGCGTICAVDLRNHGESPHSLDMRLTSMGQDVIRLVDQLKLQDVCLIGHSLGGKVTMCATLMAPEKFSRLVVLDISPAHLTQAQDVLSYLNLMEKADMYRAERESDGSLNGVRQWLANEWQEYVPGYMRDFILTNLDQEGPDFVWRANLKAIESGWHYIVGFPHQELRGCVFDCPTLFLAGSRSKYVKISDFPTIRKYFPQAHLLRMRNCGHWIHVDDPHTLLNLLGNFIRGPTEQIFTDNVEDLTTEALMQTGID